MITQGNSEPSPAQWHIEASAYGLGQPNDHTHPFCRMAHSRGKWSSIVCQFELLETLVAEALGQEECVYECVCVCVCVCVHVCILTRALSWITSLHMCNISTVKGRQEQLGAYSCVVLTSLTQFRAANRRYLEDITAIRLCMIRLC